MCTGGRSRCHLTWIHQFLSVWRADDMRFFPYICVSVVSLINFNKYICSREHYGFFISVFMIYYMIMESERWKNKIQGWYQRTCFSTIQYHLKWRKLIWLWGGVRYWRWAEPCLKVVTVTIFTLRWNYMNGTFIDKFCHHNNDLT